MTLSVAMCTYNGERFLAGQLASIALQTRLPDQLIVCDDRSRDRTQAMLAAFASDARFPVELHINESNLGSTRNFEQAIRRCTGDVIVLADQDDLWSPTRLEEVEAAFAQDPSLGMAFSNAVVIDAASKPLQTKLWDSVGFSSNMQSQVRQGNTTQALLKHNVVTGATMAFRANFREQVLPIPPAWVHDGWIALIVSAFAGVKMLANNAISYRKHETQQIGPNDLSLRSAMETAKRTGAADYLAMAEQYSLALDRIRQHGARDKSAVLSQVERKIEHLRWRAQVQGLRFSRIPRIMLRCVNGDYFRYSDGWKSIAKDLLLN